jgi:hypothetical protein
MRRCAEIETGSGCTQSPHPRATGAFFRQASQLTACPAREMVNFIQTPSDNGRTLAMGESSPHGAIAFR